MELNEREKVYDIAIQMVDKNLKKQAQASDIVAIRPTCDVIGKKEGTTLFWLRVKGFTHEEVGGLKQGHEHEKKRFCVSWKKLKNELPEFDEVKAKNPSIYYQLYFHLDDVSHLKQQTPRILDIRNIILDKRVKAE